MTEAPLLSASSAPRPTTIGVFDSGFGGLTVLRALIDTLPGFRFVYLGDTARLPYGSKSQATVARYAVSSARFLIEQGAELLVIACNTASALALDEIRSAVAPTPVVGVIAPGADATLAFSPLSMQAAFSTEARRGGETATPTADRSTTATILVLATAATVASGAYTVALASRGLAAYEKACPLLVPLVEEGWTDHPVTAEVARIYLAEALAGAPQATTLLLGCTHYPLLASLLARTAADLDHPLHVVDSARATAQAVLATLEPQATPVSAPGDPDLRLFATDSVEKFQRLGSHFLGRPLPPVQLINLPE